MKAEDQQRLWAARRLLLPVDQVVSVKFEHTDEHWYSEITCDPSSDEAVVQVTNPVTGVIETKWIDLTDVPFGELIREILETV